jgi:hypothetical protein
MKSAKNPISIHLPGAVLNTKLKQKKTGFSAVNLYINLLSNKIWIYNNKKKEEKSTTIIHFSI